MKKKNNSLALFSRQKMNNIGPHGTEIELEKTTFKITAN